jgi:hypothetical protein
MKKFHLKWVGNEIRNKKFIICVDKEEKKNYNDIENHSQ